MVLTSYKTKGAPEMSLEKAYELVFPVRKYLIDIFEHAYVTLKCNARYIGI